MREHGNFVVAAAFACALALAGCGRGGHGSLVASAAPVNSTTLDRLAAATKDCLQYRIETRADGTEVWNADYFYFFLLDANTNQPWRDASGEPLAQGLLASQAIEFMAQNPALERRTDWGIRLGRQVQEVKDGKVTNLPGVTWLDDFDLDDLFAKDAAAHAR